MKLHILIPVIFTLVIAGAGLYSHARDDGTDTRGPETVNDNTHSDKSPSRTLHLSADQSGQLDILVRKATGGASDTTVSAPATVAFDPDLTHRVGPRLAAKVVKVRIDLGDHVEAGQPLAVMESVDLGRDKAAYLTATARLESARAAYEREETLAEQQISSQAELLDSRAAFHEARAGYRAAVETLKLYGITRQTMEAIGDGDAPLSRFVLTAPAEGVIQRRELVPGQTVDSDETPVHIVDTRRMWLLIDAFEKSLAGLERGQTVEFTTRALPERTFTGTIDWLSRQLDPGSRTLTVRTVLDNPDGLLRAGMAGNAVIHRRNAERHAVVPVDAVQRIDGEEVVFVPGDEDGSYRAVTVSTAHESDGIVELRSGLQPGDPVVVRGAFDLMSALTAGGRSADHSH